MTERYFFCGKCCTLAWGYPSFLTFVSQAYNKPYSMMASLSAMSPSTMRWMMLLCSSSDRLLWDTSGVLYLVAGDGSTPWSHAWLSISSSDARLFGSLCSIRFIRLWRTGREDEDAVFLKDQKLVQGLSNMYLGVNAQWYSDHYFKFSCFTG